MDCQPPCVCHWKSKLQSASSNLQASSCEQFPVGLTGIISTSIIHLEILEFWFEFQWFFCFRTSQKNHKPPLCKPPDFCIFPKNDFGQITSFLDFSPFDWLQAKIRQNRACRFELADLSLIFHHIKQPISRCKTMRPADRSYLWKSFQSLKREKRRGTPCTKTYRLEAWDRTLKSNLCVLRTLTQHTNAHNHILRWLMNLSSRLS